MPQPPDLSRVSLKSIACVVGHRFAIRDGGRFLGNCGWKGDRRGQLWMELAPSARGYGVGTLALSLLVEEARERGVAVLWAEVPHRNSAALGVVVQNGFTATRVSGGYGMRYTYHLVTESRLSLARSA